MYENESCAYYFLYWTDIVGKGKEKEEEKCADTVTNVNPMAGEDSEQVIQTLSKFSSNDKLEGMLMIFSICNIILTLFSRAVMTIGVKDAWYWILTILFFLASGSSLCYLIFHGRAEFRQARAEKDKVKNERFSNQFLALSVQNPSVAGTWGNISLASQDSLETGNHEKKDRAASYLI